MSTPTTEEFRVMQAAWLQEAAWRSDSEKVIAQYQRGLITFWELIGELTEIGVK